MFLDQILNEKNVDVNDSRGSVYPGKIDNSIAYITPYAHRKSSVLHKPREIETYFRLINNEDRPWRIYRDELEFETKILKTYEGVNIHYSIKDGTDVLIDCLQIDLDGITVLKLSGNYLSVYVQNLKEQLINEKLTSQELFTDIFKLTIDNLFY